MSGLIIIKVKKETYIATKIEDSYTQIKRYDRHHIHIWQNRDGETTYKHIKDYLCYMNL